MMQDFNLSEKMGYSGKGLDFLKQTTMTNILEQAADAWVEKYSFRVPYDGSNNFYDEEAAKHGRAGFIAGATSPEAKAYHEGEKDEAIRELVHGIDEADTLLIRLEDTAHGKESKDIGAVRATLQKLITKYSKQ